MISTTKATALLALASAASAAAPSGKPLQFNNAGYATPGPCLGIDNSTVGLQASVIPCGPNAGSAQTNPLARSWTLSKPQAGSGIGAAGSITAFGNLCLDVRDGKNAVGTAIQVWTCVSGSTNQQFNVNSNGTITWNKDKSKCISPDIRSNSNKIILDTCKTGYAFQEWNIHDVDNWAPAPAGSPTQFQVNDQHTSAVDTSGACIAVSAPIANGATVNALPCGRIPPSVRSWTVTKGGVRDGNGPSTPITIGDGYCLDVKDGKDADGTELQIWKCYSGSTNQQFTVNGDGTIRWVKNKNKCVDLTDGNEKGQVQLQIWTCGSNNYNQKWISYPVA